MTTEPGRAAGRHGPSATGKGTGGGIFRKAASLVGARIVGNLLTLGYTLILARISPPAEFGLVMSGFAWTMLLSVVLGLNVESGSIRYLVHYREDGRTDAAAGFIRFNRSLILGMALMMAAPAALAWAFGWIDIAAPGTRVFLLSIAAAPVVALTRVYGRHATALGQVLRGGLPIMLVRPAVIFVLMGAIWYGGGQPGLETLMLLLLVAFTVTALVQAMLLRGRFDVAAGPSHDYSDKRRWIGTGISMAPLLVLRDNLKHAVIAAAGLALDPVQIGSLALALSVMSLAYFSMKSVDIAFSPQLSRAVQTGAKARATALVNQAARLKCGAIALGIVLVVAFGGPALSLFGAEYRDAVWPLFALMIVPASEALFGPAQIVLNVTGRQNDVFRVAGISTVLLIGATVLGGWFGGATGAALGAGLSYAVQQAQLRRFALRASGVDTSVAGLWARQDAREDA